MDYGLWIKPDSARGNTATGGFSFAFGVKKALNKAIQ
jgi:hypothetical protein